jgi:hypothetical protein
MICGNKINHQADSFENLEGKSIGSKIIGRWLKDRRKQEKKELLPFPALRRAVAHTVIRPLHTDKGMVRSDISKPALICFPLQEYTQQNPLSKF